MEFIQLAGFVVGIDGGDDRVDRRFGCAPAETPDHHRQIEQQINRRSGPCRKQYKPRADDETGGRKQYHFLGAQPVEQRANDEEA